MMWNLIVKLRYVDGDEFSSRFEYSADNDYCTKLSREIFFNHLQHTNFVDFSTNKNIFGLTKLRTEARLKKKIHKRLPNLFNY